MSRYQPASSGRRKGQDALPLPRSFAPISELLDDSLGHGKSVSVVGVVKDIRLPIPTKGTDYKCTLTLYDISTQDEDGGINLNIFRRQEEMPEVEAGDVVIAFMVKCQIFSGAPSLLSQFRTDVHVYEAQRIPKCRASRSARGALKEPSRKVYREPDAKEHEYVLWLYENIDRSIIPDPQQFSVRAEQSLNIKNKFSLLKDVKDGQFADLIVQVVREPFDFGDKMNLWVSDYTENNSFFHRTHDSSDWTDGRPSRDGDPYGYTNKLIETRTTDELGDKWMGPQGKMSLQLTCWEPHAEFVRNHVSGGNWVRLRNVQIGYGHNSVNIEGFLRADRNFLERIYVDVLDPQADRETMDHRLVDALRRKREYEQAEKQKLRAGGKRKAEVPVKKENSKSRRMKRRAEINQAIKEKEEKQESLLYLNDLIRCENSNKQLVHFSTLLEPVRYETTINNETVTLELPFNCAKYRTQAHVVDFHPASLEDFAVSRQTTEYDCLSDNSGGGSDSSSSEDEHRAPTGKRIWEWRFAIKLEEATPLAQSMKKKKNPATAWVLVNNRQAQLLTGLDAADLHSEANAHLLSQLREQLFKLWGDLEERKSAIEARKRGRAKSGGWQQPPPDSEDEAAGGGNGTGEHELVPGGGLSQSSNRPFTCCIEQYGVKVNADEGDEASAGGGKKWQRVFGLFGTKIVSD